MKKILLFLFALLQLSIVAKAQEKFIKGMVPKTLIEQKVQGQPMVPGQTPKKSNTQMRIALGSDERLLGFYTTDEYGKTPLGYGATYYLAGAEFTPKEIGRMVSGEIVDVRFALYQSIGASKVYIYYVDQNGDIVEACDPVSVASTKAGWNEVELPSPVTIKENTSYIFAYEVNDMAKSYPLLTDKSINPDGTTEGGLIVNDGTGWYSTGGAYGNLCIQAVVKGGDFVNDDVSMKKLSADKYAKSGSEMQFKFNICNIGLNDVDSYTLKLYIDGAEKGSFETPVPLTYDMQTLVATVTVPDDLAIGEHALKLTVDKVNGVVQTNKYDDHEQQTSFIVYQNAMEKKYNLIEQFTSQQCTYCPLGYTILNKLESKRDDLAWVSLHCSGMGNDEYFFNEINYLDAFENSSYPSASFNRYYVSDYDVNSSFTVALPLGYPEQYADQVADMFSDIIDESCSKIPAFASVDISTAYDASSRTLNVKVLNEAVDDFDKIVGDAAVTVYLIEDGLVSKQYDQGRWDSNFEHNHVVRGILSSVLGDKVTWTNGKSEKDYSIVLDSDWNPDNMSVVAFIGRPIVLQGQTFATSVDDAYVINTNKVNLGGTTGIENLGVDNSDSKEVARYTIDGVQITAPQKGINIVKMSDGKVYKVLVK